MNNNAFFDVYYQPGDTPVFCYRSGLLVYEEVLSDGMLVSGGYNGAGYPQNVLTNCPSRMDSGCFAAPYVFDIEVNGTQIGFGLRFHDFLTERTETSLHAVLTLESTLAPVLVHVHTVLDGTQMFTRYLTLESRSAAPLNVSRMGILTGGLEVFDRGQVSAPSAPEHFYSLGYFDEDEWGREGDFSWHPLMPDTTVIDTRFGRDRFRHPLFFLRNELLGRIFFCQIGWSGGCRFTFDYNAKTNNSRSTLGFCAEVTGYAPLLVLRPGERFDTPEVHMGMICGGLDDAVNEMHTHIRRSVLDLPQADPTACTIGCGMGAEHDMSVETTKAFIDQFADMGGELFIIDAGWQNPPHREMEWWAYNGLNRPDGDRYPNGLAEISDYCRQKGMKFALWIEIERLGERSPMVAAHPEWRTENIRGHKDGGYLNFANPEAAAWAESELARMIEEYKLDLLRVDYNVGSSTYFGMMKHADGTSECISLRHFRAVYQMYRNLKIRFPHVIFENCAGGGGRTDLGQMKAFTHTWVSDWQKMPRSALITNGMTMALPPERVDRLFAGMGCHEFGAFDAHMRNVMLTHMSLNVVAPAATYANPTQMDFVRHSVSLYKTHIRPMLPTCRVFHHTPDAKEAVKLGYTALEIAAPDGSRGAMAVFAMIGGNERSLSPVLRGIDAAKTYRVTLDNSGSSFTERGHVLLRGLPLTLPAALSSELVLYEEVSD